MRLHYLPALLSTLVLSACADIERMPDPSLLWEKVPAFNEVRVSNLSSIRAVQLQYTNIELEKALRVASQALIGRDPRNEEISKLSEGITAYEQIVTQYLQSTEFRTTQLRYFQNLFEMSGVSEGINFDEPANLAVFLAVNDEDFRKIITAEYCVDNSLTKVPCSTFINPADQPTQSAGVLTTRAFLKKWEAPFNFRRVSKGFKLFSCSEYPDLRDEGLTEQEISDRVKPFNSTTESPVCYSCHKSMNPRAALFYSFDRRGFFNPNPNTNVAAGEITLTDTGAASTIRDVLQQNVSPKYHGQSVNSVREYAIKFSQTQAFRDCLARRLVNQMLGRSPNATLPAAMQDIRDNVGMNEFKIKKIFLEIARHPAFVLR